MFGLACLAAITGCHARYKNNAHTLGRVRVQVRAQGGPSIVSSEADAVAAALSGELSAGALIEAGLETATLVLSAKAERKLRKGVTRRETREAMAAWVLQDAQAQDLPYTVRDKGRSRMLIVVRDYGVDTTVGSPVAFLATSTSIFNQQGRPVYRATETCTRTLGTGMQIDIGDLSELAAMQRLADTSPAQFDRLLARLTRSCAKEIAEELSAHLQ